MGVDVRQNQILSHSIRLVCIVVISYFVISSIKCCLYIKYRRPLFATLNPPLQQQAPSLYPGFPSPLQDVLCMIKLNFLLYSFMVLSLSWEHYRQQRTQYLCIQS